jgi:hypothetical protein
VTAGAVTLNMWTALSSLASRQRAITGALVAAVVGAALGTGSAYATASSGVTPNSVLIVGDSIVAQATPAARYWAPAGAQAWVFGGPGSAPCDWASGYRDPFSGTWESFDALVERYRPAAVELAFSGNPGYRGRSGGCVDNGRVYGLSALLASYRSALEAMASFASAHGARVYLEGAPPRNPATPPGFYRVAGGIRLYGFNGVPELNDQYAALAASPEGRRDGWIFDDSAAMAVSGPGLSWRLDLPCQPLDLRACRGGQVQVRAGGFDSIHLDPDGSGATRYGMALVRRPLDDQDDGI